MVAVVGAGGAALVPDRRRRLALAAGVAVLLVAASPPVHAVAEGSLTGHMVQHLLVIAIAAPMLGVAVAGARRRVGPGLARRGVQLLARPSLPLAAAGAHVLAVSAWHLPVLYDAADRQPVVHLLQHATFLGSAVLLWAAVVHHGRRRGALGAVAALFVTATAGAALGALMLFGRAPLYAQGTVSDQQVAGVLMASGTAVIYIGAAAAVLIGLIERTAARPRSGATAVGVTASRVAAPARSRTSRGVGMLTSAPILALPIGVAGVVWAVQLGDETHEQPVTEQVERGQLLYRGDCAWCHGIDGEGSPRAASLQGLGAAGIDYVLTTGRMPIGSPRDTIRRGEPAYSDEDISAIVAYAATFIDGPGVPDVDTDGAALPRGGEQFRRHCAACHSSTGIGGALAFGENAPALLRSTPTQVAEAILVGPGTMPTFAAELDADDIAAVAAYVELIQDPPRRGIPLPGMRVTEGLVAWAAMTLLLVVAAKVGTRA